MKQKDIDHIFRTATRLFERILIVGIIIGVVLYGMQSVIAFWSADWSLAITVEELIRRALLISIGIELARMLMTHSLIAIIELLAFVVARKVFEPDLAPYGVLFEVGAFIALLAAHHYFFTLKERIDWQREECDHD